MCHQAGCLCGLELRVNAKYALELASHRRGEWGTGTLPCWLAVVEGSCRVQGHINSVEAHGTYRFWRPKEILAPQATVVGSCPPSALGRGKRAAHTVVVSGTQQVLREWALS